MVDYAGRFGKGDALQSRPQNPVYPVNPYLNPSRYLLGSSAKRWPLRAVTAKEYIWAMGPLMQLPS